MSLTTTKWAWLQDCRTEKGRPSSAAKLVLVCLADYAAETGERAYPSIGTICKRTLLDDRTVRKALVDLQRAGLIEQHERHQPGERQLSFEYRLKMREATPPKMGGVKPATPPKYGSRPLPNMGGNPTTEPARENQAAPVTQLARAGSAPSLALEDPSPAPPPQPGDRKHPANGYGPERWDDPRIVPDPDPGPNQGRPTVNGYYLDGARDMVTRLSGAPHDRFKLCDPTLIGWYADGYDDPAISEVIRRIAAKPKYRPPQSLRYFDEAIREKRPARKPLIDPWAAARDAGAGYRETLH